MAVVILAGDARRERSQFDGRCVGHPNLGAPGGKPVCDGVDSPRPLPTHDGMREDPGVKPGSARSDFHGGAAAVQLPQRPSVCVGDGDVSPRASLDRAEGDGVLIQPALFSPFRQD